jgi:hypothetical protein
MGTGQLGGPTTEDAATQQSQTDYWNERLAHMARRMNEVAKGVDLFSDRLVGTQPSDIGQDKPESVKPTTLTEKIEFALAEIDSAINRAEQAGERLWQTNLVQR